MSNVPERELNEFETALRGLVPSAADFDRDGLFFRAGQNGTRGRRWIWPLVAGGLAVLSGTLAVLLAVQPGPVTIERVVYVEGPKETRAPADDERPEPPSVTSPQPAEPPVPVAMPGSYLHLRDQVLRFGVEVLPEVTFPETNQFTRPMSVFDSYERTPPKS